ncbi:MAG: hypothetical protein ACKVW3_17170 [Phycisphaerales bacterium]
MRTKEKRQFPPSRRVLIRDDRGRPFPLLNRDTPGADIPREATQAVETAIAQRMQPPLNAPLQRGWASWYLAVAVFGPVGAIVLRAAGAPGIVANLAYVLVFVGLFWVWRGAVRRELSAPITHALVARRLCASCGYSLAGLGTEPDGCTVCPECSAAWRVPEPDPNAPPEPAWRVAAFATRRRGFTGPMLLTAVDARGRLVPIVEPEIRRYPPAFWANLSHEQQMRIDGALRRRAIPLRVFQVLGGTALMIYGLSKAIRLGPPTLATTADALLAVLLLVGGAAMLLMGVMRRLITQHVHIVDAMMRCDHCPSCAAPLPSREIDTDNRTCTRCSAVWSPKMAK